MFVGLSVVGSALVEIINEIEEAASLWRNIGAGHGLLVVGLVQCLHALGDLLDGMNGTIEARQEGGLPEGHAAAPHGAGTSK